MVLAWEEGRTGYPYIDAIMTQLKMEGWIHHLARHSVACFLTRGDLYQSWEAGAKVGGVAGYKMMNQMPWPKHYFQSAIGAILVV